MNDFLYCLGTDIPCTPECPDWEICQKAKVDDEQKAQEAYNRPGSFAGSVYCEEMNHNCEECQFQDRCTG